LHRLIPGDIRALVPFLCHPCHRDAGL
jgi:hypothetical protein